jgi:hypothetical protein
MSSNILFKFNSVFILVFFSLYVLKQTFLIDSYMIIYKNILMTIMFLITLINFYESRKFFFEYKFKISILFLFIMLNLFLFQNFEVAITTLLKYIFIISFLNLFLKKEYLRVYIYLADILFITTLFIIIFSQLSIVPTMNSSNMNWIKNYGGFINPNIPPFFILNSLVIYYIFDCKRRFIFTFSTLFLLANTVAIFSRTVLGGSVILLLLFIINETKNTLIIKKYLKYFFIILLFVGIFIVIYPLLFKVNYLYFTNFTNFNYDIFEYNYPNLVYIDNLLSNRIYMLYQIFYNFEGNSLSGYVFKAIDNIYYEFIYINGIYFLILIFISFYKNYNLIYSNSLMFRIYEIITLIFILGFFDGFLNKISFFNILMIFIVFYDSNKFKEVR